MDRKKLISGKRVRASSVLEVIVSMMIIILVFGIAMMIYTNVSRQSLSGQKLKAQAILAQIMKEMGKAEQSANQESIIGGFTVERSLKPYAKNGRLLQIDLIAFDQNNQLLAELHQLIIKDDDQ
ncbi:MAG TPA: hypothetical protein VL442_08910 [Mucilaginibacter sp.]|nr:hypothetical protein [Mucilaginibacter sp.]